MVSVVSMEVGIERVSVVAALADSPRAALTATLLSGAGGLDLLERVTSTEGLLEVALQVLPDVVLIELGNPSVDPVEVVRTLRREAPVVRVLPFAERIEADTFELLIEGTAGALAMSEHRAPVSTVVEGVARREMLLPRAWAELVMQAVASANRADPFVNVLRLTDTEREVLERLCEGALVEALADEYKVTQRLVALHIGYIVSKVQCHASLVDIGSSLAGAGADSAIPTATSYTEF
jgi:DNA-binding NarL/FixJ family response regulator